MYSIALKINKPIISAKLKEKIITNNEATIAIIITANSEIGSPKIMACFLIFR